MPPPQRPRPPARPPQRRNAPPPPPVAPRACSLDQLATCEASTTFDHGEFVIDDNSRLGTLLEISGRCRPPEDPKAKDVPSRMALAGQVHMAVRGLGDVAAWVERIRELRA